MQLSKFENFLNFRINNPEFFLVSANVINNGISHFIYNKLGLYGLENTLQVNYEFNNDAWLYPEAAIYSFNKFKDALYENNLEKFNFDRWILSDNEIFSINLISWFGKDFAEMDIWGHYDEPFLSWVYPARIQRKNCIYGGFLAVHYSYFTQRKVIDSKPEILDFFKQLSNNVQLKNPA